MRKECTHWLFVKSVCLAEELIGARWLHFGLSASRGGDGKHQSKGGLKGRLGDIHYYKRAAKKKKKGTRNDHQSVWQ